MCFLKREDLYHPSWFGSHLISISQGLSEDTFSQWTQRSNRQLIFLMRLKCIKIWEEGISSLHIILKSDWEKELGRVLLLVLGRNVKSLFLEKCKPNLKILSLSQLVIGTHLLFRLTCPISFFWTHSLWTLTQERSCQVTAKLYTSISQGLPQKVSVRSSDYYFIANPNKRFLVSISK